MVVVCLLQTPVEPKAVANPIMETVAMLGNSNYLVFILVQLAVSGMQQFYFLGTGQFMQDRGISGKNISAAMGIAQAVQAAATILLLGWLIENVGFQWTFVIGSLSWSVLFLTYILTKTSLPIVCIQAFHGLAYVFFIICGQKFVGAVAPEEIGAAAQSLLAIATTGIGLFVGTQLAGIVMERNSTGGKFQLDENLGGSPGNYPGGSNRLRRFVPCPKEVGLHERKPDSPKAAARAIDNHWRS